MVPKADDAWVHICLASGVAINGIWQEGEGERKAQESYIVQATRYFPLPAFSIALKTDVENFSFFPEGNLVVEGWMCY